MLSHDHSQWPWFVSQFHCAITHTARRPLSFARAMRRPWPQAPVPEAAREVCCMCGLHKGLFTRVILCNQTSQAHSRVILYEPRVQHAGTAERVRRPAAEAGRRSKPRRRRSASVPPAVPCGYGC